MRRVSDDVDNPHNYSAANRRTLHDAPAQMETGNTIHTLNMNMPTGKPEMPLPVNNKEEHSSSSEVMLSASENEYQKSEDSTLLKSTFTSINTLPSINIHTEDGARLKWESKCVQETGDSENAAHCSDVFEAKELNEKSCSISRVIN
uniref:Uncharacterized protein LOC111118824 n=1 Tax=Crassostrea virginica TaxID=6565 RepID=A0A8B8CEG7_CRAVI|nr:uncharacterized protein LOC111118824 [Crassostrea virginica]